MKLSIRAKLILSSGIIILAVVVSFIYIVASLNSSKIASEKNIEIYAPSEALVSELIAMINESKMLAKNWVYAEQIADTDDKNKFKAIQETDFLALKKKIDAKMVFWDEKSKEIYKNSCTAITDTLFPLHTQIMETLNSIGSYEDPMIAFIINPMMQQDGDLIIATNNILKKLEKLQENITKLSLDGYNQTKHSFGRLQLILILLGLLLVTVSAVSALVVLQNIVKPIRKIRDDILEKSHGNFKPTKDIFNEDEIGEMANALKLMTSNIIGIVENINNTSNDLVKSSTKVNHASETISNGANIQASSTEEVSASMEEMNSSISQNRNNAHSTEQIALKVANDVSKINTFVNETTQAMQEITNKISIIGDIAFQTNILALNAAVEAARAGENGKGFAVVASEVRKLAERSKLAADEINEVSNKGVNIAEKAAHEISGIVPEINKTASLVQDISAASIQQDLGAEQINQVIQQLNNIAQQNASSASDLAYSSKDLNAHGNKLLKAISFFKIGN
ncbi:MAG: methyl-accepting chemotaxis protein [Bacteroidales bacterium]|nr:methyl-accepting chemotaxis protein [Bacteroidales bacterium]